jgi:WhiB family redox-sensing transcriptional regulator
VSYSQYRPVRPPDFVRHDGEPLCRREPDLFENAAELGRTNHYHELAKAVCAQCPLMQPCRAYALMTRQPWGIWGGLSVEDRLQITRKANRHALADAL